MYNIIGMAVGNSLDQLLHHKFCNFLTDRLIALSLEVVAHRTVLKQLCYDTHRMLGGYMLMQLQYEWMLQFGQNLQLLLQIADAVLIAERRFEICFDRHSFACEVMCCCSYNRVCTFGYDSSQSVLFELVSQKVNLRQTLLVPVPQRVLQRFDAVLTSDKRVDWVYFRKAVLLQTAILAEFDLLHGEHVGLLEKGQLFVGIAKSPVLGAIERGRVLALMADFTDVGQPHQFPQLQL